ncbi:SDA1 domain [Dillenia turbinata]|uniref:Protein SDA1 n=1 Tax=Dillenia turbinata TaxID=194707 RepID=A0AAN8VK57_9MAGN
MASSHDVLPESLSASGKSSEKLSLPALQSKMKCDPEGYVTELNLIYSHFKSSLDLFQQQAALNFTSISGIGADPTVSKELADHAMFLSHVTPFYPSQLSDFPKQLADLLRSSAKTLPSNLRCHVAQALILLINRKIVDIEETLDLFMGLQTLGDRTLRKLAFSHVVHSIRRMNQKHKNEAKNRGLQAVLFTLLQQDDESRAKRALITICNLHRRKVWFDDRTANAICMACFHSSSRIMIAALSFLLDYEKIEDDDDSDDSDSEDDIETVNPHVVISKEAVYKAHHKGTAASKKKKKAKLQRAIRSMKRQQRMSAVNNGSNYYSPLNHLKDAQGGGYGVFLLQGFAEKLFSRLQNSHERFEVKMMMLKVIARTVGLHRLILLNFYPFIQKYIQPHQSDVTNLLAAAVQACHDMVPPDAVEPLFKQVVNQFVNDRSRPEAISIGLNVVREICLRMPLLMNEDLLQDLALYKKSHEKSVNAAARSLIALFREVCPSLLIKKDRGRPTDPKARPKAFGEVNVASDVPGIELLQHDGSGGDGDYGDGTDEDNFSGSDDDHDDGDAFGSDDEQEEDDGKQEEVEDGSNSSNDDDDDDDTLLSDDNNDVDEDDDEEEFYDDEDEDDDEDDTNSDEEEENITEEIDANVNKKKDKKPKAQKRKFSDFNAQLNAANTSLRALKKLAEAKMEGAPLDSTDGILSNEDFRRIKELKAKTEAKIAMSKHGMLRKSSDANSSTLKIPSSDQLSAKPLDPSKLEVHVRKKLSKEEKLELVRAGREERGKYQARSAIKQKKTGGLSNRQKEHMKAMPLAAKRAKATKSRQEKNRKRNRSGKQFRGKKAWK